MFRSTGRINDRTLHGRGGIERDKEGDKQIKPIDFDIDQVKVIAFSKTETIRRFYHRLPTVAVSAVETLFRSEPARTRGHGDCGACAV